MLGPDMVRAMTYLQVIIPSRGRPHTVAELAEAFEATCGTDTRVTFAVDYDDPQFSAYRDAIGMFGDRYTMFAAQPDLVAHGTGMCGAMNQAAMASLEREVPPFATMFMGDDHRVRPGAVPWDVAYLEALAVTPIVYGNDLFQGPNIPTQFAMRNDVVKALGHVFPSSFIHLYLDDYVLALGRHIGIRYLPEVVVEHLHPAAGKADMDQHYARVNAPEVDAHDKAEFLAYLDDGRMATDVKAVLAAWAAA